MFPAVKTIILQMKLQHTNPQLVLQLIYPTLPKSTVFALIFIIEHKVSVTVPAFKSLTMVQCYNMSCTTGLTTNQVMN